MLAGYLIGTLSPSAFIAKLKKDDLRKRGTGNLGATNVTMVYGRLLGVLVMIFDIMKGFTVFKVSEFIAPEVLSNNIPIVGLLASGCAVIGHIFPFYLKFKGGKGFASYFGMTLALNWKFALVIALLIFLATVITDYIVAGTTLTIVTVLVYLGIAEHSVLLALILCVATMVILYKHRVNYVRIWNGTEIGLRSVMKGKHRVT